MFSGSVDVIVTDGFTGNVMLKLSEGLTDAMLSMIKRELTASAVTRLVPCWLNQLFAISRSVSTILNMAGHRSWVCGKS